MHYWIQRRRTPISHKKCRSPLNARSTDQNVQNIHDELKRFISPPRLAWCKAHCGILGNERADCLAKQAARNGTSLHIEAPFSFAKRSLVREWILSWTMVQYFSTDKGRQAKRFFPTVETRLAASHFNTDFITTHFLSGHGKFASYLARLNVWPSATCLCGASRQTASHLVFSCPNLDDLRVSIFNPNISEPFVMHLQKSLSFFFLLLFTLAFRGGKSYNLSVSFLFIILTTFCFLEGLIPFNTSR